MDKDNLYFVGFMGAGKSAIARLTARFKRAKLIEMDETLEAEAGVTISEIFAEHGEEYFRDMETALIERIAKEQGVVVSCGGGAVLRPQNVEYMKRSGKIIYLSAEPETIYQRVRYSTKRPLLQGNMNIEYIAGLMEKRTQFYEQAADYTIQTDGKEKAQILEEVLTIR